MKRDTSGSQPPSHAGLDVLGVGVAVLDVIGSVDRFPAPDSKTRIVEMARDGGGPAATAMVTCSRLGLRAGLVAKVGDDDEGRFLLDGLRREGVDVSQCVVGAGQRTCRGFCFAHRKTGQRIIYFHRSELPLLEPATIDRSVVGRAPILLTDGCEPSAGARAAELARGAGALTVMDAGSDRSGLDEALPHIDYLVASWDFARERTQADTPETMLEALRWTGYHRAVVITLGEEGYLGAEGGREPFRGKAFRVKAKDTTGAGDVFHGAFCVGLARGWPLEQICSFSAACAALKCRELGGRRGIPTWPEAIAFCRENDRRFRWPE